MWTIGTVWCCCYFHIRALYTVFSLLNAIKIKRDQRKSLIKRETSVATITTWGQSKFGPILSTLFIFGGNQNKVAKMYPLKRTWKRMNLLKRKRKFEESFGRAETTVSTWLIRLVITAPEQSNFVQTSTIFIFILVKSGASSKKETSLSMVHNFSQSGQNMPQDNFPCMKNIYSSCKNERGTVKFVKSKWKISARYTF